MSSVQIFVLAWLGTALLVIVAGLRMSTRTRPDRYAVWRIIEHEEPRTDEGLNIAKRLSAQTTYGTALWRKSGWGGPRSAFDPTDIALDRLTTVFGTAQSRPSLTDGRGPRPFQRR